MARVGHHAATDAGWAGDESVVGVVVRNAPSVRLDTLQSDDYGLIGTFAHIDERSVSAMQSIVGDRHEDDFFMRRVFLLLRKLAFGVALWRRCLRTEHTGSSTGMDDMRIMPAGSGARKSVDKMGGMSSMHHELMGTHMMPAIVTSAGNTIGPVDVMAGGMD